MLVDSLCDVGQPISDRQLLLNTMCGVNEHFSNVAIVLSMQTPFQMFTNARSSLLLQEVHNGNACKIAMILASPTPLAVAKDVTMARKE